MKCLITGRQLKEEFKTLGWEGNDMVAREFTPEMAVYFINHLEYCDKNQLAHVIPQLQGVVRNSLRGETTLILLPFWQEIIKSFKIK